MTLGPGEPRATCPHCHQEGSIHHDQERHGRWENHAPLSANIRFTCKNKHAWTTPIDDAELMGAFLDRQPS